MTRTRADALIELSGMVEGLSGPNYAAEREIAAAVGRAIPSVFEMQYDGARVPYYTASVDAAMTLVPGNYDLSINREQGRGVASVFRRGDTAWAPEVVAATPALALTAASLRALAQEVEGA